MSTKPREYDVQDLNERERELLKLDILAVAEESDSSFGAAQEEHMRRVGGQENLRSYIDSLVASDNFAAGRGVLREESVLETAIKIHAPNCTAEFTARARCCYHCGAKLDDQGACQNDHAHLDGITAHCVYCGETIIEPDPDEDNEDREGGDEDPEPHGPRDTQHEQQESLRYKR